MNSKQTILSAFSILFLLSSFSLSEAGVRDRRFTIQVAAFQDDRDAGDFIARLKQAGESPVWGTVEIPGRGIWIRIMVGLFVTASEARDYGKSLVKRGAINEFLVRPADSIQLLSRPRTVIPERIETLDSNITSLASQPAPVSKVSGHSTNSPLPVTEISKLALGTGADAFSIPRPDPVRMAFKMIVGDRKDGSSVSRQGGLWVSGDIQEAITRLRWILGEKNSDCLNVNGKGRVEFDSTCLSNLAGLNGANPASASLIAADYIYSNEGLLLLVQLTQGGHRYKLHIGSKAPTYGANVSVTGTLNLDNNYDSRINPNRDSGKKLDHERPPAGFDSLIALNPVARWFNLATHRPVPVEHITFHELVEAYAKVELGLDYLSNGARQGAHLLAIERERRLEKQRPDSDVVVTTGSNRLLRSEEEARRFYAETGVVMSGQRE